MQARGRRSAVGTSQQRLHTDVSESPPVPKMPAYRASLAQQGKAQQGMLRTLATLTTEMDMRSFGAHSTGYGTAVYIHNSTFLNVLCYLLSICVPTALTAQLSLDRTFACVKVNCACV